MIERGVEQEEDEDCGFHFQFNADWSTVCSQLASARCKRLTSLGWLAAMLVVSPRSVVRS